MKRSIPLPGSGRVVLMNSISYVGREDVGAVVVSGSHGGASSARYVLGQPLAGACINDAGGGKEDAGVAGLPLLDEYGIPACAVAHTSAHIVDAEDTWTCGVLTMVNRAATAAELRPGMGVQEAAALLAARSSTLTTGYRADRSEPMPTTCKEHLMTAATTRPDPDEYAPSFAGYVACVPEGNILAILETYSARPARCSPHRAGSVGVGDGLIRHSDSP